MTSQMIAEQLKHLPASPGVYIFRDAEGNILYVGKAANLHHRVRSYFGSKEKLTPKVQRMVSQVHDLEFFVTSLEQEALILEYNLIKRHHPHYNVRLKDDKTFPFLKISLNEDWPRVYFTRRVEEDGGRYFGPFASARSVRQTLKVLKAIFPFRSCSRTITGNDPRACLEYHMGLCVGPCVGEASKEEYAEVIKQVILFLEGKQERIVLSLKSKMKKAAEALDFEKAAQLRDQIQAIERVIEGQRIATRVRGEQDVVAFAQERDRTCAQVFFIRSGKLIGRESFILQGTISEEPKQIMSSFIKQFYGSAPYIPLLILLQHPVEDKVTIEGWLQSKRGSRVHLRVPYRGDKKQLVDIVAENAERGLQQLKIKQQGTLSLLTEALAEIEKELHLPRLPSRMEGYDVSNIQGRGAVGSMVVFEKGKPKPAHYRRFRIKTVFGVDDYAMLKEVLRRRFKRFNLPSGDTLTTEAWAVEPDLVLIDGGKGQLSAALSAMREAGAASVPVASLAKENESIFIPGQSEPVSLPSSSPGLQLVQRLRDEAHRFALGYHQRVRKRETFASSLDSVPGIGPRRKRALLKQFGSLQAIREASEEELAAVKGMTRASARKTKEYL
ncbi:MAG: excinuclease ABC subunit UvrC [Dehalococcoidales bacterium]|nr:excinuclease ABC subunit UvrC [Dehalococcoidales bacterium]